VRTADATGIDLPGQAAPVRDRPVTMLRTSARWWVPLLVWIVCTALAWTRLTPITRNTVWAEDGTRFLSGALHAGPFASVFMPYAGYLHFVARVLADLTVLTAPATRYAVTIAFLSCLVTGAVGAGVYLLSAESVPSRIVRVALGLVPALAPLAPVELLGNAANIHSFLLYLAPFVFLAANRGWLRAGVLGVVAFAIACTEIQSLVLLPVVAFRIRSRRQWPIAAGALLGWVMQVTTTLTYPRPHTAGHDNALDLFLGYVVQPFAGAATWHTPHVGQLVARFGWLVLLVPFVLALVYLIGGAMALPMRSRVLMVVLAAVSVITWASSAALNDPGNVFAYAEWTATRFRTLGSIRYSATASLFVLALVLVATSGYLGRIGLRRALAWVVLVAVAVVFVVNFHVTGTRRMNGPAWASQIVQAEPVCRRHPDRDAVITVAPGGTWVVSVPCAVIDRTAP
jgi:hypothetical protein